MLRWSARSIGKPVDLAGITDDSVDSLVPAGEALVVFTDAVITRAGIDGAREAMAAEVGDEAAAMAASTVANFEMMNRILDATGVPAPRSSSEITDGLGIDPETFGRPSGL